MDYCTVVRQFKGCGKEGKWFEPTYAKRREGNG
jgi:hypothetical protein